MQYTSEMAWNALEANSVRMAIAIGNMDEPEDAEQYARGLEVLKTARVIVSERTTVPRMSDGSMWYEYDSEFVGIEKLSPVYVFEVGHIATSPAYVAVALIPRQYATANEAAAFTNTSESGWRNRAAAGQIPGAVKRGKTWLIPWPQMLPAE